jgi:photosystem II stability/assembly factor-like uncharacterized protein
LGFLKSTDGGDSWTAFGPFNADNEIFYFDVSTDGRVFYAHEYTDAVKKIHKSLDASKNWTAFPGPFFGVVKVSPEDSNLVLFSCTDQSENWATKLCRSTDGLENYSFVISTENVVNDIQFAPSDPDIVYVACEGYDIYKSTDAGSTFELMVNLRSDYINVEASPMGGVRQHRSD